MKRSIIVILILFYLTGFSNPKLNIFHDSFDQAIDSAKTLNKDIFFITRSLSCPVFEKFETRIDRSEETIEFLNSNFIIFEYDMDNASQIEKKRLKNYYHSWRGFPQLYFIDKNEKLISDMIYSLNFSQQAQLTLWKNYKKGEKKESYRL